MEWYVVQSQDLHGLFSSLGSKVGEEYRAGKKCLETLKEILSCLLTEDRLIRNFRRALGISRIIHKDLIPLLIYYKDDKQIVDATIRVMVNLTLPVECLLPVECVSQTESGHQIISDLNCLLMSAKVEFADPRATLCLLQRIRAVLGERKIHPDDCESVGNCLLLLRNILHVPENRSGRLHGHSRAYEMPVESNGSSSNHVCSKQNLILWNLFAQNFDKLLIHLMTCEQRSEWEVPLVQLVALTFKDQRMATLLKMLHLWLETSVSSESSEDNESNTSPQPLNQGSGNSSPMLTSEPTSDSSDNGGGTNEGDKSERTQKHPADGDGSREIVKGQFDDASSVQDKERNEENEGDQSSSSASGTTSSVVENKRSACCYKEEGDVGRGKELEKVEEEDEMVRELSGGERGDADSGIFPPSSDQSFTSSCEKKHKGEKKDVGRSSSVATSPTGKSFAVSEQSDCGYSTQVENQHESMSTSSNEDEGPIAKRKPGQQKHHSGVQDRKAESNTLGSSTKPVQQLKSQRCGAELRRKRLVKRARIHSTNLKAMVHHTPSDEDISNLLKEFTLDFMSHGYGLLVSGLHMKLLSSCSHKAPGIQSIDPPAVLFFNSAKTSSSTIPHPRNEELPPPPIDTSHFFWLITFFLRFSWQLGLEFDNVRMVLSYDILSYLIYEGVGLCEEVQLALNHSRESDVKTCLRRMHLVVTAIREFVQAVETYGKMAMTTPGKESDKAHLQMLQKQMASTRDLRCLFVLLLQHCDLSIMSRQYLQDIVVTNHLLLLFLEGGEFGQPEEEKEEMRGSRRNSLIEELEMAEHITHFANGSIVQQYGRLLEAFQENGEFVNDCIFTMLHHIGGEDVKRAEALFQPALLWSFSAMWETDFDICDDWSDLIEYIIYKFISNPQHGMKGKSLLFKKSLSQGGPASSTGEQNLEESGCSWSPEELRDLRWFYSVSCEQKKVLDSIVKLYHQKLGVKKNSKEVLKALLSQEVITLEQFAALKNKELPGETSLDVIISSFHSNTSEDDAEKITADLISEGLEKVIHWLQDSLLEACFVKLHMKRQRSEGYHFQHSQFPVMEPVAYHYALMGQPIPIIPWGVEEHSAVVENVSFGRLLKCLGIQKPREDGTGGIFPRIPNSLSPLDLLEAARKLGKLASGKLKFDPAELQLESEEAKAVWRGDEKHVDTSIFLADAKPKIFHESFLIHDSHQKPVKSSSPDLLSSMSTQSRSQNSPSQMDVNVLRSSNINWLNVVKRSKSPALIAKNLMEIHGRGTSEDKEDLLNVK
ncbi:protein timeless isoform X2 [Ischnura elegans]|uniref:protein timeless isoform X2 n=1 Tax=Ischnura elegans TaxID=197161 RepID=UPI001ED876F5|nr:protein timeless isoform X2 [Ischnura elegans]